MRAAQTDGQKLLKATNKIKGEKLGQQNAASSTLDCVMQELHIKGSLLSERQLTEMYHNYSALGSVSKGNGKGLDGRDSVPSKGQIFLSVATLWSCVNHRPMDFCILLQHFSDCAVCVFFKEFLNSIT